MTANIKDSYTLKNASFTLPENTIALPENTMIRQTESGYQIFVLNEEMIEAISAPESECEEFDMD